MDGLEGASLSGQKQFDRQSMDQMLSALGNRVFLMNNVHEDAPTIFETRWALSYLRGPLTREQIKVLVDPLKNQLSAAAPFQPETASSVTPVLPSMSLKGKSEISFVPESITDSINHILSLYHRSSTNTLYKYKNKNRSNKGCCLPYAGD
jgi:hypothetical protein